MFENLVSQAKETQQQQSSSPSCSQHQSSRIENRSVCTLAAEGKRMNPSSVQPDSKKRDFVDLITMTSKISSTELSRDVKRTRTESPETTAKKLTVHAKDMPLLPIVTDAKIPDPKESKAEPDEYLKELVKAMFGVDVKVRNGLDLGEEYFKPITEAQQAAYTMEVLTPARENDVKTLKELVAAKGPQVVNCVNRFGESLLNLACRRGFTEVAEFLLSDEISLDVRLKDDFGRTPLHDTCWHPKPQQDICSWLIQRDPSLLLVTDKRGNTPFMYARAEDFPTWRQFLFDNRDSLQLLTEPSTLKLFS